MTREELEKIYRDGIRAAEAEFGPECRDYDRVLAGVAAVLRTRGFDLTPLQLADYWHNPLAGTAPSEPVHAVFGHMEAVLSMGTADGTSRDATMGRLEIAENGLQWRQRDHYIGGDPEQDAEILIASEIKSKYPKVRRNTKRWRELHDSVVDQAREIIKERNDKRRIDRLAVLRRYVEQELRPQVEHARGVVKHLRAKAEHVRILRPDSEWVAKVLARAEALENRAARVENAGQAAIQEHDEVCQDPQPV